MQRFTILYSLQHIRVNVEGVWVLAMWLLQLDCYLHSRKPLLKCFLLSLYFLHVTNHLAT